MSLYIDQFPENDLARATAKRHGVPIHPTVEDALTLGGSNLAVDGVVIIGEHGDYPAMSGARRCIHATSFSSRR